MRKKPPNWREFEKLVARIEEDSRPLGWVVRSPDRIRCKITAKFREVDASIRIPSEHSAKLIIVECRERSSRQDVTWIEQLATKKKNLGADTVIAVSSKGFSTDALKLAVHYEIQLRTLGEISLAGINPLIKKIDFVLFPHARIAVLKIACRRFRSLNWTIPKESDFDFELPEDTSTTNHIFRNTETGHTWSLNDMWLQINEAFNPFQYVPRSGRRIVRTTGFPYPGNVELKTGRGIVRLGDVALTLGVWFEIEQVDLEDAKKRQYRSPDGPNLHRIEFASRMPGVEDWRLSMQTPEDATEFGSVRNRFEKPSHRS